MLPPKTQTLYMGSINMRTKYHRALRQKLAKTVLSVLCAMSLAGLAGCDSVSGLLGSPIAQFNSTSIENADFGQDFHLHDFNGQARSLADFRGKAVLIFFGYTHCPDICPTELARAASAIKLLGDAGKQVQVLFVTLDPQRDTPEVLRNYVPAFHPDFLGLYGSEAETKAVSATFRVFYQKTAIGNATGDYAIDHSVFSYIFDPEGKLRLLVSHELAAEALAADLRKILGKPSKK